MVDDGADVEDVVAGAGVAGAVVWAKTTVAEDRAKRAAAVAPSNLLVMGISFCLKVIHVQTADPITKAGVLLERWRSAYPSLGSPETSGEGACAVSR
jgi:hypothetical protein